MICSCGGKTKDHDYKTVDGVRHYVWTCQGCGRQRRVDWKDGKKISEKG